MSLIRPRRLTPRGIVSTLLPLHFQKLRHPQQLAKGDVRTVMVPLDVDADMYRVDSKKEAFTKALKALYSNEWMSGGERPKNAYWCVVARGWVPKSTLIPGHIWPPALGSSLLRHVTSLTGLKDPYSGLLLPKPTLEALTDLALVIVPDRKRDSSALADTAPGGRSVYSYRFCVMDEQHPAMSTTLFLNAPRTFDLPLISTGQLNGRLLVFANRKRPSHSVIYFQACCAIWKATYLEDPDCDNEADFVARYQTKLRRVWGSHSLAKGESAMKKRLSFIDDIFLGKCRDSQPLFHPAGNTAQHTLQEAQNATLPASEHQEAGSNWSTFAKAFTEIKEQIHRHFMKQSDNQQEQDDLSGARGAVTPTRTSHDDEGPLLLPNQDDLPWAGGYAKPAKEGHGKDGPSMMSHEHTEESKKNWKRTDRARLARTSRSSSAREAWRETGEWKKDVH